MEITAIVGIVICALFILFVLLGMSESYRLIAHKKLDDMDYIFTLEKSNSLTRLFNVKPRIVKVVGGGTVWNYKSNFKRCGTMMEGMLSNFHTKIEFEEKYGEDT